MSRTTVLIVAVLLTAIPSLTVPGAALGQTPFADYQIVTLESGLSLHKEMFMLPFTWSEDYNGGQSEAVFQISAKHRLFGTRFFFGYTQISFWQAYDFKNSAPFRDTNYNPEIVYRFPTSPFRSGRLGLDAGFEHESNGQIVPASRSWNLLYVAPHYQQGRLLIRAKIRYRLPEDDKEYPLASEGDDNPDITDYLGHVDLHVYYRFRSDHQVHLKMRGNPDAGRGFACLSYSIPVPNGEGSHFVFRVSNGYGESMMDYNKSNTRVGAGLMFTR